VSLRDLRFAFATGFPRSGKRGVVRGSPAAAPEEGEEPLAPEEAEDGPRTMDCAANEEDDETE